MSNLRTRTNPAAGLQIKKADADPTPKNFISPREKRAELMEAISAALQAKSNEQLETLLARLQGMPDGELKYPHIKHAQRKFSKLLAQPELQN